ncbi:MAG TPA: MFS transporter [Clostridia bacterium]|nr:MFS transporter [Clostridia bacterium]
MATLFFISTYYLLFPALPLYLTEQGLDKFTIGLIMGTFSVSSLFLRPISGHLIDLKGRKGIMFISIGSYLLSPLFFRLGFGTLAMGAVQVLFGFAIGSFTTAIATYVTDLAPREMMARFIGWHSIAIISAKGMAPALGLAVAMRYGFPVVLGLSILVALISAFFVHRLEEPPLLESKGASTSIREILTMKMILLPTITLFAGMITFGAINVMLSLFAATRGIPHPELFFVINTLTVIVTRLVTGRLPGHSFPAQVITAMIILVSSLILMSQVQHFWQLVAVAMIYGAGYGAIYPALSSLLILYIPDHLRGTALGIYTSAFDLGVAAGAALAGLSEFIGFTRVYLGISLIPLLGLVVFITLYLPRIKRPAGNSLPE